MQKVKGFLNSLKKLSPLQIGGFFVAVVIFLGSIYVSYLYKDYLYLILGILPLIGVLSTFGKSHHLNKKFHFKLELKPGKINLQLKSLALALFNKFKGFKLPTVAQLKNAAVQIAHYLKTKLSKKTALLAVLLVALSSIYAIILSFLIIFKNAPIPKGYYKFYIIEYLVSFKYYYTAIPLAVIFVSILAFLIIRSIKAKKFTKKSVALYALKSLLFTFFLGTLALILSINMSNVYALVESQKTAAKIGSNKDLDKIGLYTEEKRITEEMNKSKELPKIVGESDDLRAKIVLATLNFNSNKSEFYQKVILPKVANAQKLKFQLPADIFLVSDNTLVITKLNKEVIEKISPHMARIMVSKHFADKYIKDNPKITLLNRQDYMKVREDQINEKIKEMDKLVKSAEATVNAYYGRVENDKRMISSYRQAAEQLERQKSSVYDNCKKLKYYDYWTGKYKSYYTDSYCRQLERSYDNYIKQYRDTANHWEGVLRNDQYLLSQYIQTRDLLAKYKEMVEAQKDSTPNELGIFEPDDKIKVVLETVNNSAIADYFATLVHEYLHYSSYISKEKRLPVFFEEALTEYFARKIVSSNLKAETNLGYPIYIPLIQKMIEDIGEDKFEKIYFTKDEKALQALLDEKYGNNFYSDSNYYFLALGYIQSKEALDIANNIMFKIGGKQLEEKDLYSKWSDFNQSSSQK